MNIEEVQRAVDRLKQVAHCTPVMTCATLDHLAGQQLFFKCELFQKVGAFKFRGAYNAVSKLDPAVAARGVVTHSSGNHAQALALAARLRGIPAHIVMPRNAPAVKREAVLGYGARVISCDSNLEARESTAAEVERDTGATLVPPYNHPDVIAGQGTVALELLEQRPDVAVIVAPIGGGGLVSGICAACGGVPSRPRVIAAEPTGADDAFRSKQQGRLVPQTDPHTVADGLRTSLGPLTWPFVRDQVERIILVTDDQIVQAMRLLWERAKLMVEPSAAVPLAAVLTEEFRGLGRPGPVGVVLTGGNVDVAQFPLFQRVRPQ